jgi:hypothetical protein
MEPLAIVKLTLIGVAAGLLAIVFFKLMSGHIETAGLLRDKISGGFSPTRAQLMLMTLFTGAVLIADGANVQQAKLTIDPELLTAAAGSASIYGSAKLWQSFGRSLLNRITQGV